jgi:hypothetical protein
MTATEAQTAALEKAREAKKAKQNRAPLEGLDPEGGASFPGKQGYRMQPSSREIKMLRPQCEICEERLGGSRGLVGAWQDECEHDPYVTLAERKTRRPVYEPVDPDDPAKGQRVVRMDTVVTYEPVPNWVSVTHGGGVNKGRGVERALKRGYIFPQQLRSKAWPNGIKRRCQFRDCTMEDLTQYVNGWFCREHEAKLVRVSDSETTWEVGQFSKRSDQIQKNILDAQAVRF